MINWLSGILVTEKMNLFLVGNIDVTSMQQLCDIFCRIEVLLLRCNGGENAQHLLQREQTSHGVVAFRVVIRSAQLVVR